MRWMAAARKGDGMIENIKRIGLFMIAAQTFMHFAAGQQYEKYMKIIAGVIVILLFISPFSSAQGNLADQWQKEAEQITDIMEEYDSSWAEKMLDADYGSGREVVSRFEEEIRRKLNNGRTQDEYYVTDVAVDWEKNVDKSGTGIQDMAIGRIRITLQQPAQTEYGRMPEEGSHIAIERIQIGGAIQAEERGMEREGQDTGPGQPDTQRNRDSSTEQERRRQEYRSLFAKILGIEEGKVEVIYSGSGQEADTETDWR